MRDFVGLPRRARVAQFPYEGGLVRKDLLILTVRSCCYVDEGEGLEAPAWWLPAFDLATEFHLFRARCDDDADSEGAAWIVKPAQGTHARGHAIVRSAREVALLAARNDCDRVAQRLVTRPLLVHGRKFDLRVYCVVRAFAPHLDAAVHAGSAHARLAIAPYDAANLGDADVQLTVRAYDADADKRARQRRLAAFPALADALREEHDGLDFDSCFDQTVAMIQDLLQGAVPLQRGSNV